MKPEEVELNMRIKVINLDRPDPLPEWCNKKPTDDVKIGAVGTVDNIIPHQRFPPFGVCFANTRWYLFAMNLEPTDDSITTDKGEIVELSNTEGKGW